MAVYYARTLSNRYNTEDTRVRRESVSCQGCLISNATNPGQLHFIRSPFGHLLSESEIAFVLGFPYQVLNTFRVSFHSIDSDNNIADKLVFISDL
jgi:hypothetical protein